jgi:hypothetical protein
VEELLESTIAECAKQAGTDVLPRKAAEDGKLAFTIDEMFRLRPIYPKK